MPKVSGSGSKRRTRAPASAKTPTASAASVFAALGDETRLALVRKLTSGPPRSIAQLTEGTTLTRQAVTKHIRVLQRAGVLRSLRSGRETLCEFLPEPIHEAKTYLDSVSQLWDEALVRLKSFVEE